MYDNSNNHSRRLAVIFMFIFSQSLLSNLQTLKPLPQIECSCDKIGYPPTILNLQLYNK